MMGVVLTGAPAIDLEDWRSALDLKSSADHRSRFAFGVGYVRDATIQMLSKLGDHKAKATLFFILGWATATVAEIN